MKQTVEDVKRLIEEGHYRGYYDIRRCVWVSPEEQSSDALLRASKAYLDDSPAYPEDHFYKQDTHNCVDQLQDELPAKILASEICDIAWQTVKQIFRRVRLKPAYSGSGEQIDDITILERVYLGESFRSVGRELGIHHATVRSRAEYVITEIMKHDDYIVVELLSDIFGLKKSTISAILVSSHMFPWHI